MNRRGFIKGLAAFTAATAVGAKIIDALPEVPEYEIQCGQGLLAEIEKGTLVYEPLTEREIRKIIEDMTYHLSNSQPEPFIIQTGSAGLRAIRRMQRRDKLEGWLNRLLGV